MNVKKFASTVAVAGALSAVAIGLGAGTATADPDNWWVPVPPPGHIGQVVGVPPGHIGQLPFVPPPGHWDKPGKWWK